MKQKYFLPLLGLLFSVGIVSSNAAESVGKINGSQESGMMEKQNQADINELSKKLRDAVNEKDL